MKITQTPSYSFVSYQEKDGDYLSSGRSFSCNNHNAFLNMMDGAISGKTGFTGNAGYCYVGALRSGDRTFVVALLACGWPNNKTYKWSDTKLLMNYGIENYEYHRFDEVLYDASNLKPIPVVGGQSDNLDLPVFTGVEIRRNDADSDFSTRTGLLLKKDEQIQVDVHIEEELNAPVSSGTEVGRIRYLIDGQPYRIEYILTTQDIPAIDYSWCFLQILKRYGIYHSTDTA